MTPQTDDLFVTDVTIEGDLGYGTKIYYDWGDGSEKSSTPTHVYEHAGTYTLSVTAGNSEGFDTYSMAVWVSRPPVITDFAVFVDDLYIEIRSIAVGPDATPEYSFSWGDRTTSNWPAHGYLVPGKYPVSVTASDRDGEFTKTKLIQVNRLRVSPSIGNSPIPIFRGQAIDPRNLHLFARRAAYEESKGDLETINRLFETGALNAYSHIEGCQHYSHLNKIWLLSHAAISDALKGLGSVAAEIVHELQTDVTDSAYLLMVLTGEPELTALRAAATESKSLKRDSQVWYSRLENAMCLVSDAPEFEPGLLWLKFKSANLANLRHEELEQSAVKVLYSATGLIACYQSALDIEVEFPEHPPVGYRQILVSNLLPPMPTHRSPSEEAAALAPLLPVAAARLRNLAYEAEAVAESLRDEADRLALQDLAAAIPRRPLQAPDRPEPPKSRWSILTFLMLLSTGVVLVSWQGISGQLDSGYLILKDLSSFGTFVGTGLTLLLSAYLFLKCIRRLVHFISVQKRYGRMLGVYSEQLANFEQQQTGRRRMEQKAMERYQERRRKADDLVKTAIGLRYKADELSNDEILAELQSVLQQREAAC
jgi:PKD repeat protein